MDYRHGGLAGLIASIVGQVLLGDRPWVQVRAFHTVRLDRASGEFTVTSYVKVANVRGRPLRIELVSIVEPDGLTIPESWLEGLPIDLEVGADVRFGFERTVYPNVVPIAIDNAGRVWPRRRWWRARSRAQKTPNLPGILGLWGHRGGPSERQLTRLGRQEPEATDETSHNSS